MIKTDHEIADAAREMAVYVPAANRAREVRAGLLAAARDAGLVDVVRVAPARRRWPWIVAIGAFAAAAAAATTALVVNRPAEPARAPVVAPPLVHAPTPDAAPPVAADAQTIVEEVVPPPPPPHRRGKPAAIIVEPERPAAIAKRPIELLFEQGWAELATNPATAAATFEKAARAAPADPLAEDAWFWRASALARAKSGGAAAALAAFLASYPSSPRAGEASAMLGWLVVDRDLGRAEALFRTASADRVAAVRASGEKGLALVASRRH